MPVAYNSPLWISLDSISQVCDNVIRQGHNLAQTKTYMRKQLGYKECQQRKNAEALVLQQNVFFVDELSKALELNLHEWRKENGITQEMIDKAYGRI